MVRLTREWAQGFDDKPGVYAFFEQGRLCYVGETRSIRDRMVDMLNTKHHTLRRHLGAKHFAGARGYKPADSRHGYTSDIEGRLDAYIRGNLTFSVTYPGIGRKELEEYLSDSRPGLYNRKAKRGESRRIRRL